MQAKTRRSKQSDNCKGGSMGGEINVMASESGKGGGFGMPESIANPVNTCSEIQKRRVQGCVAPSTSGVL